MVYRSNVRGAETKSRRRSQDHVATKRGRRQWQKLDDEGTLSTAAQGDTFAAAIWHFFAEYCSRVIPFPSTCSEWLCLSKGHQCCVVRLSLVYINHAPPPCEVPRLTGKRTMSGTDKAEQIIL